MTGWELTAEEWSAIRLSLKIAGIATLASLPFGIGMPLTLNDLVRAAARTFGVEDVQIAYEGAVAEHHRFRVSPARVAELYNFVPHVPLEDGLHRLHRFILEHAGLES